MVNDNSKPLIFLGSNIVMEVYIEACEDLGIEIHGIIDNDYFGNTDKICDIPVIDTEQSFNDPVKRKYYQDNFNFFCAVNWLPLTDEIAARNKLKRQQLINVIENNHLNCISIVDRFAKFSKTTKFGRGCFIDGCTHIMPRVSIGDFTTVYTHTNIGHDAVLGKNCVIQRMCVIPPYGILEDNVFFGSAVKALKQGAVFGENSFINEGIYIKRGTVKNEVVSMNGDNMRRVVSQYIE
jgi:acetyltransferase-like isoleucine patch superfamily enzyme